MTKVPPLVTELAQRCRAAGGRALLVGGGVRDAVLGRELHDFDIEVFGIPEDALFQLLRHVGTVNAVGRSFGVFKVTRDGFELDVSLPRRDSKAGPGHRGIAVVGDPFMDAREAARRRDLTVNAILEDPLTGEIIDPWGGEADARRGLLRAVDAETFLEDPLRALRVVQLAARLGFAVDPATIELCRSAQLEELPAERIQGEWVKLLLKSDRPSHGFAVARAANILVRVFPEAVDDPRVDDAIDAIARRSLEPEGRRLAGLLAAWLHATPPAGIEATLDRLWLHKWRGYPLRDRVLSAVAHARAVPADDAALRRLATACELRLTFAVHAAVTGTATDAWIARAEALGVAETAADPLLKGRHLAGLGVKPGPAMGRVLSAVYELQLDGAVVDPAGALDAARKLVSSP
jgi:tRNA nucleotidyltransferase (CCA-adding enzyme)